VVYILLYTSTRGFGGGDERRTFIVIVKIISFMVLKAVAAPFITLDIICEQYYKDA
jgi:hypothetical protein